MKEKKGKGDPVGGWNAQGAPKAAGEKFNESQRSNSAGQAEFKKVVEELKKDAPKWPMSDPEVSAGNT